MRSLMASGLAVLLLVATAPPALAAKPDSATVDALTAQTGTVLAGDSAWVEIVWEASDGDVNGGEVDLPVGERRVAPR